MENLPIYCMHKNCVGVLISHIKCPSVQRQCINYIHLQYVTVEIFYVTLVNET